MTETQLLGQNQNHYNINKREIQEKYANVHYDNQAKKTVNLGDCKFREQAPIDELAYRKDIENKKKWKERKDLPWKEQWSIR